MTKDMTRGTPWKLIVQFALPIMAGNLLQQLYNTADTIIVGNFNSQQALSAVGSCASLTALFTALAIGFSIGAGVLISQYFGANRLEDLRRYASSSIVLMLALGLLMSVLGFCSAELFLEKFLGTPQSLLPQAALYFKIYAVGLVFQFGYNIAAAILRALGDSKRPLLFLVVCTIVNTILDLFFVAVLKLEVAGAAIATSLSQLICAWLVIRTLQRAHGDYRLDLKKIRPDGWLLKRMLVIGLPAGISSVLYNITNVYVQKAINLLGTDTVAAWSVYWKLDGIFWPISNAIGIAVMTFAGQNYGARKKDRILQTMHVGIALHLAICALIGGFIYFTRDWTIRLFNSDPAVVEQGRVIITYLAPCYFLFSATEVLSSMMRGVGNAVKPTIITLFGACVLRLILLFTMTFPHLSNLTIALCYPITWTAASVMFLLYYKFGKWLPAYPQKQPDIG